MRLKTAAAQRDSDRRTGTEDRRKSPNGSFCLEPRDIDFVSALVPGLLMYIAETGQEVIVAIDEGTLVKCGDDVFVSTYNAFRGDDLATFAIR